MRWPRARTARWCEKHLATATFPSVLLRPSTRSAANTSTPYVNLHRPCLFAREMVDAKGKVRKTYPHDMVQTPLDKLASLDRAGKFLRKGIAITQLQSKAKAQSDLEAANAMNVARLKLFDLFNR